MSRVKQSLNKDEADEDLRRLGFLKIYLKAQVSNDFIAPNLDALETNKVLKKSRSVGIRLNNQKI